MSNGRTQWPLLFLLLIGLLASVVGYVRCFSIVQNSASTFGLVSWLCLEAGLSLVRLAIWSLSDDAPPHEINLKLDEYEPLPSCNKDDAEILEYKVLPLTRARDFLKSITSFVGPFDPEVRNDIFIRFLGTREWHGHFLQDIELLDDAGLEYMPCSTSPSNTV